MAAYATQADMVARFGNEEVIALTDRAASGAIDADVLSAALEEATAEVEGYLAGRYALPLASPPRLVVGLVCDIARYRLSGATVLETEAVRDRYRDAVRLLEQIAAGKVSLGVTPAGDPAPASGARVIPGRGLPDGGLEDW